MLLCYNFTIKDEVILSVNTHDNMAIPIFITDTEGRIVYKNRAAKRCIPSPRTMGNINNYLNTRMSPFRIVKKDARIEFIKNSHSIFNRALVIYADGDREIWCFLPELQLAEPEDAERFVSGKITECIRSCIATLSETEDRSEETVFIRYQRVYSELLSVMKQLDAEAKVMRFGVADIVSSLKKKTEELASLHNLRISFDAGITDPLNNYKIDFKSFASVYIQLLQLTLRLSTTPKCRVSVYQTGAKLNLMIDSDISPDPDTVSIITLEALGRLFPNQTQNILFLDAAIKLYGFEWEAALKDGKMVFLVSVSLEKTAEPMFCQEPSKLITRERFRRTEKRIYEYIEAMFMQI